MHRPHEEIELEKKRAELSTLKEEVAQDKLHIAALQVTLEYMHHRYLRDVDVRLAKFVSIVATIKAMVKLDELELYRMKLQNIWRPGSGSGSPSRRGARGRYPDRGC